MLYSKKDFKIFLEKRNYMPKNGMPDYVRYILNSRSPKTRFNSEKAEYTPVGYGGLYTMNEPWGDDLHNEVPDYGWDVLPKDSWERTKASNWDRALNWAQDLADKARSNATELRPNRAAQYLSAYPNTPYVGLTVRESPNKRTRGKTDVYGVKANWMNMPVTGGIANSGMTKRASMCKCGSGMSKSMCKCGSGMSKSYGLSKAKEKICDCGRPVSKCTCSGHEHGKGTSKRMSKSKSNVPDYVRYISQSRSPNARTERKTDNPWTADGHFGSSAMEEINNMFPGAVFTENSQVPGGVGHMNSYLSNWFRNTFESRPTWPPNMGRTVPNRKKGSGVGTSKRMSKSMDMKTRAPKMPSTRRDIRNTDKYFR